MVERRKFRRFKGNLVITTVYRNESDKIVSEDFVVSEDVGMGGMRIVFPHRLPKGKIVDLKVFLFSDPIFLPATGRVMWSSKRDVAEVSTQDNGVPVENGQYWIGIQFIDIDQFHRQRILRWIKKEFQVVEVQESEE